MNWVMIMGVTGLTVLGSIGLLVNHVEIAYTAAGALAGLIGGYVNGKKEGTRETKTE